MKNLQKGFSHIEAVLILVIVGILGFTGWYVWKHHVTKATPVTTSTTSSSNETTADYIKYENKDLGFSFVYPSDWGSVAADKPLNANKLLFAGKFDKMTDITFGVAPKDYTPAEYLGDPPCFENGFSEFQYIEITNSQYVSSAELLKTPTRHAVESYKNGNCAGASLQGRVKLELLKANGLEIRYEKSTAYSNSSIDSIKKANAIPNDMKDKFTKVVNSIEKL